MKKTGRVVGVVGPVVSVAMEGNADASVAPCCTVPSVILEAKNLAGAEYKPGELVEVTDGLGTMALGGSAFLVLPALLYAVGHSLLDLWWVGVLGLVLGLLVAVVFFKSLNIDQYPRVVGRVGLAVEESMDKEFL